MDTVHRNLVDSQLVPTHKHLKPSEPTTSIHTLSSREFTRVVSAAKCAAADGPVFITNRGRPAFVLLTVENYHRLAGRKERTLFELMKSIPGGEGIEFDPPRMNLVSHPAEFD